MTKKMYSFRLNKELIDSARKIARDMDISLSLFISCLIREKINNLGTGSAGENLFNSNGTVINILKEIVEEIKALRMDLNKSYKK
jgi:hypothetical protein